MVWWTHAVYTIIYKNVNNNNYLHYLHKAKLHVVRLGHTIFLSLSCTCNLLQCIDFYASFYICYYRQCTSKLIQLFIKCPHYMQFPSFRFLCYFGLPKFSKLILLQNLWFENQIALLRTPRQLTMMHNSVQYIQKLDIIRDNSRRTRHCTTHDAL